MGPANVKNVYGNSNYEMFNSYIVTFTCNSSAAVILDPNKNGSSKIY